MGQVEHGKFEEDTADTKKLMYWVQNRFVVEKREDMRVHTKKNSQELKIFIIVVS